MLFRYAETQRLHVPQVGSVSLQRFGDKAGTLLRQRPFGGVHMLQLADVILPFRPLDVFQGNRITYAEIMERTEKPPLDGIGKADFRSDVAVEIFQNICAVHSLRCRGEAQKNFRLEMGQ